MANLVDALYDRTKKQSDNASPLLIFLLLPALIPHELVHYLTGRLLGMEIRLYLREVVYKRTDLWKEITMALAPTVFFFTLIPLILSTCYSIFAPPPLPFPLLCHLTHVSHWSHLSNLYNSSHVLPLRAGRCRGEGPGHPRPRLRVERGRRVRAGVRRGSGGVRENVFGGGRLAVPGGAASVPQGESPAKG